MAVFVDNSATPYRGMVMCHMVANTLEELHHVAGLLGLRREWFQNKRIPHYDISAVKKMQAIRIHGAVHISSKELIRLALAGEIEGVKNEKAG